MLALTLSLVGGSSALGQLSMGVTHVSPLIPKGPSHVAVQRDVSWLWILKVQGFLRWVDSWLPGLGAAEV